MRLHRIEDGLVRMPDERRLTTHDKGGNPLSDIVDRNTGFCTGVTSNLTIPEGKSVLEPTPVSGGRSNSAPDFRFDPERQVYYQLERTNDSQPFGVVVRTVADGDELLPVTRVTVVSAKAGKTGEKSGLPFNAVSTRKQNTDAVKAVLSAMGYKGKITPEIRKAALEMIAIERSLTSQ